MKLRIAIDGACRRNGKPDCTASGGVFIMGIDDSGDIAGYAVKSTYEYGSTNQRGELSALLKALSVIYQRKCEAQIITDSEYLFNAMTKPWYKNWQSNGWMTRDASPVKNSDLWMKIADYANALERDGVEVTYYHVKGHCIPFGTVTANDLLKRDPSGQELYKCVRQQFDKFAPRKVDILKHATALCVKNNGFALDIDSPILKDWVTANVVADAIATKVVDEADSLRET